MERRTFVRSILGTAALAGIRSSDTAAEQVSASAAAPEFYVWRQYVLRNGAQMRRLADFLQNAAIPALNRLGHKPIGVFEVVYGIPTPTVFTLTPFASAEALTTLESRLDADQEFVRAGAPYFDAAATDPVYLRQEV